LKHKHPPLSQDLHLNLHFNMNFNMNLNLVMETSDAHLLRQDQFVKEKLLSVIGNGRAGDHVLLTKGKR
jgi:hypothetical protein